MRTRVVSPTWGSNLVSNRNHSVHRIQVRDVHLHLLNHLRILDDRRCSIVDMYQGMIETYSEIFLQQIQAEMDLAKH